MSALMSSRVTSRYIVGFQETNRIALRRVSCFGHFLVFFFFTVAVLGVDSAFCDEFRRQKYF